MEVTKADLHFLWRCHWVVVIAPVFFSSPTGYAQVLSEEVNFKEEL